MKIIRLSRVVCVILALVSMLCMQLVLAGYVCPKANGNTPAHKTMAVSSMSADMPECAEMDVAQPTLCHASAHTMHQSLDKHELPPLTPFVPVSLSLVLVPVDLTTVLPPVELNTVRQSGAPPPSLAIRYCCFRI